MKKIPIVVDVIDARRPNMQEKGRDIAIAPEPILSTFCAHTNNMRNIA